ncbi:hypothetical protein Psuf_014310 [Phytohabitans suffuscus]|uniref:Recombinase domain-containing protein n=2 Tax=Phytohabitans suffuscus TaxID=624315 RepID=A0A6F8YDR5_9ACTN|nr:hypothetical protein Psuf_014310 [Phytohabitans suffuscus]
MRKPLIIAAFELMATGLYTLATLHEQVTVMGLRSRPTKRRPNGSPIGLETLRKMLRDRYYIGWVSFKGVEYKGRHETFISEELFERVQRVLDSHQGAGVRERQHPHYLKGWLFCHRCGKRFIVQRARGNGGEYYYFFCIGRQDATCDHPYVPVEKMEEAIEHYYAAKVRVPEAFLSEVRSMVDEAVATDHSLTDDMRKQFARRLQTLDKQENYFLDLAAEEGWPKEKLREKLQAIRTERSSIQRNLDNAAQQLATGRDMFYRALDLLARPAELYAQGDEVVRSTLNKAFFAKFLIDGTKVADGALKEPFDGLVDAADSDEVRVYLREIGSLPRRSSGARGGRARSANPQIATCPTLLTEDGAPLDDLSLTEALELALLERARGSSNTVMVGAAGFEPATPRL